MEQMMEIIETDNGKRRLFERKLLSFKDTTFFYIQTRKYSCFDDSKKSISSFLLIYSTRKKFSWLDVSQWFVNYGRKERREWRNSWGLCVNWITNHLGWTEIIRIMFCASGHETATVIPFQWKFVWSWSQRMTSACIAPDSHSSKVPFDKKFRYKICTEL
jgi:hypothetical protein